jgi:hypothetical protein
MKRLSETHLGQTMEKTPRYGFGMVMVKDGRVTFIKSYGSDPISGSVNRPDKPGPIRLDSCACP